jgi:predicted anti-sigma-YlaC factor YlaD
MQVVPSVICDRVRSQVSLELDRELSEFERLMVARHLEGCAGCRSFRDRAVEIAHEMRSAPFERFERRVVLPRIHRGRLRVARDVAVRASAMAAGLLMVLGLGLGERGVLDSGQSKQVRAAYLDSPNTEMKLIRELRDYRIARSHSDARPI